MFKIVRRVTIGEVWFFFPGIEGRRMLLSPIRRSWSRLDLGRSGFGPGSGPRDGPGPLQVGWPRYLGLYGKTREVSPKVNARLRGA